MPITWTIDHDHRMLSAACEGDVTLRDIEEYLNAVVEAGTMPCRKLFDAGCADSLMSNER